MAKGLRVVYTTMVLLWSTLAYAQDASVLFVVDGSGSMAGRVKGQPKIGVAKAVMSDLLLKLDPAVRAGLLVYGHNRKDDCGDIEVMAPLGSERGAMVQALKGIQPKGKTPLTEAIRRAAAQFREYEGSASVVVVSDGKETCEGDPCAAASEASGAGVNLRIHVIGFDVTPEETEQLTCVADKGKGKYFAAADAEQLVTALAEVEKEVVAPTPPPEPKKPANEASFGDHFDRNELGEMWEVINSDPNRLAMSDGKLITVATTREDSATPANLALLRETPAGDFVATVKMTAPVTLGIVAGLYCWVDDQNHLRLGPWGVGIRLGKVRAYDHPRHDLYRHPVFSKVLGAKTDQHFFQAEALGKRKLRGKVTDPEVWYLQLERRGVKYTGRMGVDGVEWATIGTHVMVQKNGRLGLGAYQDWEKGNEQPVEFDDFVVKGAK